MKTPKLLLLLALSLFAKFTYAQSPDLELGEYVIDCNKISTYVFINDPEAGLYIVNYWGDGDSSITSIFDSTSAFIFASTEHYYTSLGTYTNKHVLYNSDGIPIDSFLYSIHVGCQGAAGKNYLRKDTDCMFNGTDEYLGTATNMRIDKDGVPIDTFSTIGEFIYSIDTSDYTSVYTLQPVSAPPGYTLVCPDSGHYDFTLTDLYSNPSFDFGYDCDASAGFNLFTFICGWYRSVDTSFISINYGNISCNPQDGIITLNIDPQYDFAGASVTPTTVTGSTITWDIAGISGAFEWLSLNYITVNLVPNTTLELGNIACNTVTIMPTMGDSDITNNTAEHCDSIRSAFDPNNKTVSPSGAIDPGTSLTYTINFENLGNDSAFNIHIIDTLSANVDPATFAVLNASDAMTASLSDYGSTKIVRFDFANIMLPDISSPNYNKGFVTYSVNAKTSLAPTDEIENTAYIYFDINPAVVTNTVTNFVPDPSSIKQLSEADNISIFPNPAEDKLTIINESNNYQQLILINSLGQSLFTCNLKKGDNSISIQQLPSGIYYAIFTGRSATRSLKIIKK